jgi:hypothetical protein
MNVTRKILAHGRLIGICVLSTGVACSDDASDGGSAGIGGSAGSSAGAAGSSAGAAGSSAGAAGSGAGAAGSASSGGATYSAAQACERFAAAACNKGAECGLVIDATPTQLVCVNCTPAALDAIATGCASDAPGDKDRDAVDSCVAALTASSCADACADVGIASCAVFGALDDQADGGDPVVCDSACVSE